MLAVHPRCFPCAVSTTAARCRGEVCAVVNVSPSAVPCFIAGCECVTRVLVIVSSRRAGRPSRQKIPHSFEQIHLFANADIVITAHTGGLLNVGYMRPFSAVVEIAGYHSKPVAYDFLWGSARVHHVVIESSVPNITIHDTMWNPRKEELITPPSIFIKNYADRERGGRMNHLFGPTVPKGLLVNISELRFAVERAVRLVSDESANDVPVTPWRLR